MVYSAEWPGGGHQALAAAMGYVGRHCGERITLEAVARHVHLNKTYLSHLFVCATGQRLSAYINRMRIERSMTYLAQGLPIFEVMERVGFEDQSYFTKVFRAYTQCTPAQYRRTLQKPGLELH